MPVHSEPTNQIGYHLSEKRSDWLISILAFRRSGFVSLSVSADCDII